MPGFVYPNEVIVEWDLLIVIYPFITGLVAGAFIVSSLYHVFGLTKLKPVARLSLITALAFLLVTPLPLVLHLGRPERALEMFLRPNLISAMSMFGYIWLVYLLLVLAEVWFVFRPDIMGFAKTSQGLKKTVYSLLALGVYDMSDEIRAFDKKAIKGLALVGIPLACLLHGYVGFIFGAVKANPWWSTPLIAIIFLLSAIVSGMALLMIIYVVFMKVRKTDIDRDCINSLTLWLGGFLTTALALEGLEVLSMMYESSESWEAIRELITDKLRVSYLGIQFLAGSLLPLLLLGSTIAGNLKPTTKIAIRTASALLIVVGVFAMRWNVVIGGQMVSKSLRGFSTYTPVLFGQGGIVESAVLVLLPVIILIVLTRLIPPWETLAKPAEPTGLRFQRTSLN